LIASTGVVALIASTHDRVAAQANSCLAGVGLRACIPVVASRTVDLGRVAASSGGAVADADIVALVARRTPDLIAPCADSRLTGVGLRACVSVVAG